MVTIPHMSEALREYAEKKGFDRYLDEVKGWLNFRIANYIAENYKLTYEEDGREYSLEPFVDTSGKVCFYVAGRYICVERSTTFPAEIYGYVGYACDEFAKYHMPYAGDVVYNMLVESVYGLEKHTVEEEMMFTVVVSQLIGFLCERVPEMAVEDGAEEYTDEMSIYKDVRVARR